MGKRSDFERRERDYYRTWDRRALRALRPHLQINPPLRFIEPCAGDAVLVRQIIDLGLICVDAWDIEPQHPSVRALDAHIGVRDVPDCVDVFITNPPWLDELLLPLIVALSDCRPTWLLFHADWMHTVQSIPFLGRLRKVVSVGRLRWIEGSPHDHKDNCAWYLFDRPDPFNQTIFHGPRR